jgi:hypothetical protein
MLCDVSGGAGPRRLLFGHLAIGTMHAPDGPRHLRRSRWQLQAGREYAVDEETARRFVIKRYAVPVGWELEPALAREVERVHERADAIDEQMRISHADASAGDAIAAQAVIDGLRAERVELRDRLRTLIEARR